MTLESISSTIERARKVKTPDYWEFVLVCLVHDLGLMKVWDVEELIATLEREYPGHILAGDTYLVTLLEVMDGHLALREICN